MILLNVLVSLELRQMPLCFHQRTLVSELFSELATVVISVSPSRLRSKTQETYRLGRGALQRQIIVQQAKNRLVM